MLKDAMMLVLETNGSLLNLFSSGADAESHLEAIDIENGEYEFCDDTGQRFVGEIIAPVTKFHAGNFRLKPDGVPDKAVIASFLFRARSLERACGDVKSLNDLRRAHGLTKCPPDKHKWEFFDNFPGHETPSNASLKPSSPKSSMFS